jgi:hypothetical protein
MCCLHTQVPALGANLAVSLCNLTSWGSLVSRVTQACNRLRYTGLYTGADVAVPDRDLTFGRALTKKGFHSRLSGVKESLNMKREIGVYN